MNSVGSDTGMTRKLLQAISGREPSNLDEMLALPNAFTHEVNNASEISGDKISHSSGAFVVSHVASKAMKDVKYQALYDYYNITSSWEDSAKHIEKFTRVTSEKISVKKIRAIDA
jgi:hypothetical protein